MRVLSFFVTLLILIQAKEEEYSDLENYINDPAIWKYIVKRLGSKGDSPVKAEKSSDDHDDEYRASFGKHTEQKQTKQPPKPSLPSPLDSMVDSLGNLCQYKPNASLIIRSRASIGNGASFLKSFEDKTRGECVNACCYTQGCNLVVYENKGKHNCYLFNCGSPSKCLFAKHNNYTTMSFPNHAIPDVASIGDKAQHENELEGLNTKTTVPTSPKPRRKVPLYSKCDIDWNDECSDSNAECRDNLCKCSQGFHAKYGICRKNCNDDSFECENKGQRWNVPECISKQHVCDGTPQCADGSDEENCEDHGEFPGGNRAGDIDTDKGWPNFNKDQPMPKPHHKDFFNPDSSGKDKTQSKVVKSDKVNSKITDTSVVSSKEENKIPIKTTQNPYDRKKDNPTPKQTKAGKKDNPTPKQTKVQKTEQPTTSATKVKTDISKPIKNSTKLEAADSSKTLNDAEETRVVVESPTDSNQGPIVALALGLGITVILLFFVGCRLRNVKRRLRKGRALHSNEADYLINGMYL